MAEATRTAEEVKVVKEETFVLTLSRDEALTLAALADNAVGGTAGFNRLYSVQQALVDSGLDYDDVDLLANRIYDESKAFFGTNSFAIVFPEKD